MWDVERKDRGELDGIERLLTSLRLNTFNQTSSSITEIRLKLKREECERGPKSIFRKEIVKRELRVAEDGRAPPGVNLVC